MKLHSRKASFDQLTLYKLCFVIILFSAIIFCWREQTRLHNELSRLRQEVDTLKAKAKAENFSAAIQPAQEFNNEIRKIVQEELSALPTSNESETQATNQSQDQVTFLKREEIEEIVKKIIEENKQYLSDEKLDRYVASGSETEVEVGGGLTKKQSIGNWNNSPQTRTATGNAEDDSHANAQVKSKPHTKGKQSVNGDQEEDLEEVSNKEQSIERTLVQKGGLLLGKGKLQIEPSMTWANFSSNRIHFQGFTVIPINIGTFSTETVKRDIFVQNWSFKYGLFNNFQTELKVPYRFEHQRTTDTAGRETVTGTQGIGDIELAVSRQIAHEHGIIPDLIYSIGMKTPSGRSPYGHDIGIGTGHWSLRNGLIFVKSSDPAVIFGGLNYTINYEREVKDIGLINPGDSMGYSLGVAIALSYQTAINFSFDHSVTSKVTRDKETIAGTFFNVASLKTGFTWSINEHQSVDFGVSFGLTSDAPNASVELRFPYSF